MSFARLGTVRSGRELNHSVDVARLRKPSDATAGRIVSSAQESENEVEYVAINGLIGRGKTVIAEVSGPAA
jgi:hypothetical protein